MATENLDHTAERAPDRIQEEYVSKLSTQSSVDREISEITQVFNSINFASFKKEEDANIGCIYFVFYELREKIQRQRAERDSVEREQKQLVEKKQALQKEIDQIDARLKETDPPSADMEKIQEEKREELSKLSGKIIDMRMHFDEMNRGIAQLLNEQKKLASYYTENTVLSSYGNPWFVALSELYFIFQSIDKLESQNALSSEQRARLTSVKQALRDNQMQKRLQYFRLIREWAIHPDDFNEDEEEELKKLLPKKLSKRTNLESKGDFVDQRTLMYELEVIADRLFNALSNYASQEKVYQEVQSQLPTTEQLNGLYKAIAHTDQSTSDKIEAIRLAEEAIADVPEGAMEYLKSISCFIDLPVQLTMHNNKAKHLLSNEEGSRFLKQQYRRFTKSVKRRVRSVLNNTVVKNGVEVELLIKAGSDAEKKIKQEEKEVLAFKEALTKLQAGIKAQKDLLGFKDFVGQATAYQSIPDTELMELSAEISNITAHSDIKTVKMLIDRVKEIRQRFVKQQQHILWLQENYQYYERHLRIIKHMDVDSNMQTQLQSAFTELDNNFGSSQRVTWPEDYHSLTKSLQELHEVEETLFSFLDDTVGAQLQLDQDEKSFSEDMKFYQREVRRIEKFLQQPADVSISDLSADMIFSGSLLIKLDEYEQRLSGELENISDEHVYLDQILKDLKVSGTNMASLQDYSNLVDRDSKALMELLSSVQKTKRTLRQRIIQDQLSVFSEIEAENKKIQDKMEQIITSMQQLMDRYMVTDSSQYSPDSNLWNPLRQEATRLLRETDRLLNSLQAMPELMDETFLPAGQLEQIKQEKTVLIRNTLSQKKQLQAMAEGEVTQLLQVDKSSQPLTKDRVLALLKNKVLVKLIQHNKITCPDELSNKNVMLLNQSAYHQMNKNSLRSLLLELGFKNITDGIVEKILQENKKLSQERKLLDQIKNLALAAIIKSNIEAILSICESKNINFNRWVKKLNHQCDRLPRKDAQKNIEQLLRAVGVSLSQSDLESVSQWSEKQKKHRKRSSSALLHSELGIKEKTKPTLKKSWIQKVLGKLKIFFGNMFRSKKNQPIIRGKFHSRSKRGYQRLEETTEENLKREKDSHALKKSIDSNRLESKEHNVRFRSH